MATASSAEVQKNFGRYKDTALAEPVVVTQYGKPSVVILAAAEYERLKELDRRILLLDETLAGLGRDECNDVLDVLQRLRAEGMTIVIIEHTMHAMLRIADHFVVLDHGRVLAAGKPCEVVEQDAVIEAYLGKKFLARLHA